MTEDRKTLKAKDLAALDDSDFAYVDSDGDRHLPIHDEAHVRAALARFGQTQFDSADEKTAAAKKIVAKAKTFGIEVDPTSDVGKAAGLKQTNAAEPETEERAPCPTCKGSGKIMAGNRKCPDCQGSGVQQNAAVFEQVELADLEAARDELNSVIRHRRTKKPRHRSRPLAPEYRRSTGLEVRQYAVSGLEVREAAGTGQIEVTGSPIVYGTPYTVLDMLGEFEETMHHGVCSSVLADQADVRFLFNHDGLPLARTTSGTLRLTDTATSLQFKAVLDSRQQLANDLAVAIERGDVSQMSCGFVVADDEWSPDWAQRDVYRFADLLDVSAVTYPASPTTSIEVANRMMLEVPVESRTRLRKFWAVASELRAGAVISAENAEHVKKIAKAAKALADAGSFDLDDDDEPQADAGPDGTQGGSAGNAPGMGSQDGTGSREAEIDAETRAEPTEQDDTVAQKLQAVKAAIADALAAQEKDPDQGSDPDDAAVCAHLSALDKLADQAIEAQAKDGAPDEPPAKRSAALKLELDLMAMRRRVA
jgi:Escherichia/Staphylococcus phage prohead protease